MTSADYVAAGPSFALSTLRYPFVWINGVLNGYSSTNTGAGAGRPDGIMLNLGTNDWGQVVGKTFNNTAAFVKVRALSPRP